jgi:deoxyribodipyrimidine photo-lyase
MQLVWFRHDLRIHDNAALTAALETGANTAAVFVRTAQYQYSTWRQSIQLRSLKALAVELAELGIALHVLEAATLDQEAHALIDIARLLNATTVYANRDHGIDELKRDRLVEAKLKCQFFGSDTILPLGTVQNGDGAMYRVFTPFAKRWKALRESSQISPDLANSRLTPIAVDDTLIRALTDLLENLPDTSNIPVDDALIERKLKTFLDKKAFNYRRDRDFPAIDGTSHLSSLLAVGRLSAKRCLIALENAQPSEGQQTWLNEIIWREFYRHLMFAFPSLSKSKPFQPYTDAINWHHDDEKFERWTSGQTGFPIVDAAMRCLKQTGWMHNRLRMVVASFLCKDLGIDWRWGEQYFLENLVDADFPSNNGGWQWAASTGADAAPYFRIFNPTRQSERFDAAGDFIRAWVPELRSLDNKQIHAPNQIERLSCGYPNEMVDRRAAKDWIVGQFKLAKEMAS